MILGRENVTLSMIEHHDIKTLHYAYMMLNDATGMCIYDDVSA